MKLTVIGRKFDVDDAMKAWFEKKLCRFDKFFNDDAETQVKMSVEKNRHIIEVTITYKGMYFRTQQVSNDMYSSLDMAIDALEKQILRQKTRLEKRFREGAFSDYSDNLIESENEYKIIKTKRFNVKPMDIDEAILQMDLLGHEFFVFRNVDTNEVDVVYKRKDGNYGLIESGK